MVTDVPGRMTTPVQRAPGGDLLSVAVVVLLKSSLS